MGNFFATNLIKKCFFVVVTFNSMVLLPNADAEPIDACITQKITMDLLGGRDDTPLVPVSVDDKSAALYISFASDNLYLHNSDIFNFVEKNNYNLYFKNDIRTKIDKHINGYSVVIKKMNIANIEIKDFPAILLEEKRDQSINGVPIIGLIGYKFFQNFSVLLDIPNNRITLLQIKDTKKCEFIYQTLLGSDYYSNPLEIDDNGATTRVKIGQNSYWMGLDTDVERTQIPEYLIKRNFLGITNSDIKTKVSTEINERFIMKPAKIKKITVGDYQINNISIDVSEKIRRGYLGIDFFKDKLVLLDFPTDMIYFSRKTINRQREGYNSHYNKIKTEDIRVYYK